MRDRTWPMFAGNRTEQGIWLNVEGHPKTVEAYGAEPVAVTAVEDPEGEYRGWIDTGSTALVLVQPQWLFSMQFPYGPEAEVDAGKGEIVRLRIDA